METGTLTTSTKESLSKSSLPNPFGFKKGEEAIMNAGTVKAVWVTIDNVSFTGYGANVTEIESGQKWSCSMNCLTRGE